jgi:DNA-binding transcriptional ArsR family regulator
MEIDRKTLKALSADTRLDILQSLGKRRKMPSELSKELNLATSTVVEHLNRLEEANLISREETGHKWIYYSLTDKGSSVVRPRAPMNLIIVLGISVLIISAGVFYYSSNFYGESTAISDNMRAPEPFMAQSAPAVGELKSEIADNTTNSTNSTIVP